MKIPIILLNYNSSEDCRKCVEFLKRQTGVELEIIIVDNCSHRDDCMKVESLSREQGCTFIPANENQGYNAGNNIGLRYAVKKGYKYALIVNPDMVITSHDYIYELIKCMENKLNVVVIGSDILHADGFHQNPMIEINYWKELFWPITGLLNQIKRKKNPYIGDYTKNQYCNKLSGCCFLIRLSFVESIKFFDENVFLYCEESILGKQVEKAQKLMYYLSEQQAVHQHIRSKKANISFVLQQSIYSRLYFLYTYCNYSQEAIKLLLWSKRIHFLIKKLLNKY